MNKRTAIIAGNHKMNFTNTEAEKFINELKPLVKDAKAQEVICVPFTNIVTAVKAAKGSGIAIGSQNVSWADSGAFTGEISADMLVEAGATYAIIGHSERRQMFNETDGTVNKRTIKALQKGLKPIVCVGETLSEREGGITEQVVKTQTVGAFKDIAAAELKNVVIAYEPVWAIGTGKTASAKDAQDTIAYIRSVVSELYGEAIAQALQIQYGGSMNTANVDELMAQNDIDGGLIGGASLKAADFARIVNYN